jgi:4,5-dihydroxyphthalate decarboxylase
VAARLKALLGDYPVTRALRTGAVASPGVTLEFADVAVPHTAFKRVVRGLEFDVAELALVTFLVAKAFGKPLVLVPAVITARFQHPLIVYDAGRGPLAPGDLAGRRVGLRSYSVTTATWIRSILADDHGVDLGRVRWVTFEEGHVAEFRDPPSAERAPAGRDMVAMLLAGELDAAIVGEAPRDPRLQPLSPDPGAAARAWQRRTGAIQINHMVVVKEAVAGPVADEVYAMLVASRRAAGDPEMNPFGVEENRRNLEVAVDCVYRQGLIPRRFTVEELVR